MSSRPNFTDEQVEIVIGKLLQAGVLLSAAVVLSGGIVYLVRHGHMPVNLRVFRGEPQDLRHLRGIFRELAGFRASGIIQMGLLLLIATPVARVAFSVWAFARERDYMYVVFTVMVLAVLLYSIFSAA
jgi:uncharacterized membrane protein